MARKLVPGTLGDLLKSLQCWAEREEPRPKSGAFELSCFGERGRKASGEDSSLRRYTVEGNIDDQRLKDRD